MEWPGLPGNLKGVGFMSELTPKELNPSQRERDVSPNPSVALFQKAHQRMMSLQRFDEQIQSIFVQRRKLQEELREVQLQINDEFDRVIRQADQAPKRLLAEIVANRNTNGESRLSERGLLEEAPEAEEAA
jgi:predicted transcriptional regulator